MASISLTSYCLILGTTKSKAITIASILLLTPNQFDIAPSCLSIQCLKQFVFAASKYSSLSLTNFVNKFYQSKPWWGTWAIFFCLLTVDARGFTCYLLLLISLLWGDDRWAFLGLFRCGNSIIIWQFSVPSQFY